MLPSDPRASDHPRVVFARDLREVATGDPTILISPSLDQWNDFGMRIRVELLFSSGDGRLLHLNGFIGFDNQESRSPDVTVIEEALATAAEVDARDLPSFFTMLPTIDHYRKIVGTFGTDRARTLLLGMRDVIAGDQAAGGQGWMRSAMRSGVFVHAFLRSGDAYFAWKNAGSVLQGLEFEQVGRMSNALAIAFRLAGRPTDHELAFRFSTDDDVLPKRFAVIIGSNGTGKSQALGRIARAALLGTADLTDDKGLRPLINRVLAFAPTPAAASAFPGDRRRRPRIWYRRFSTSAPAIGRQRQSTSDLVVQLARSGESIRAASRFEIFLDAIGAVEGSEELAIETVEADKPPVRVSELLSGGEQQRLTRFAALDLRREPVRVVDEEPFSLSSGELSFIRFAALASLHIENGTLVLLDEPETHLHPQFISRFVAVLDRLLERTGSVAIIATHSVYFVREAFEDQVIVLRSDQHRRVLAEVPKLRTFGADVGAISYFVFGEDRSSRLARDVQHRIARSGRGWPEIYETYRNDLSLELLGDIRAELEGAGSRKRP